jgi:hypothetical protein
MDHQSQPPQATLSLKFSRQINRYPETLYRRGQRKLARMKYKAQLINLNQLSLHTPFLSQVDMSHIMAGKKTKLTTQTNIIS